jgi:rfaE bifunctional protein nucleotidyltransferase chain/domain
MLDSIFLNELQSLIKKIPSNKKIVLVGGCFDLLHFGHVYFLNEAKKQGDFLIIALESDNFILDSKKRHPIHTQEERQIILESLKCVDLVIPLPRIKDSTDYSKLVTIISPAVIAVSQNDPQLVNKTQQAKLAKAQVKIINLLVKFSTSNILKQATV